MNEAGWSNFEVKQEPPPSEDERGPSPEVQDVRVLDQYCRLCLRTTPDFLVSLVSYIGGLPIPYVFRSVTGLELVLKDAFPSKVCQGCLDSLENAYNARERFVASYALLESFSSSKDRSLIDQLNEYQGGTNLGVNEEPLNSSLEPTPTVSEPKTIKQEPELDLEPEEPPDQESKKTIKKRVNNRYKSKIKKAMLDPNKCYICGHIHENVESLEAHLPEHVGMIPYQCEECKEAGLPAKIISVILLHKHFRMHASAIKCPKCPIRVSTMAALYGHMQIYHGENSDTEYTCQICDMKLVSKFAWKRHVRFHKAREDGRYTCTICQKKFATKPHLTRHERSHTNERPFKCHFCPNSYKTQNVRNRHERTHTGEKGFHCEICGKRYRLRSVLNTHLESAHGAPKEPEGPLPVINCDFEGCNYSTTKKGAMYNHKTIHEPKFQCQFCPKRYPTGQKLEMHQFVHTGEKKFRCHLCPKSFRSKFTLDQHVAAHTATEQIPCEICGKTFVRERSLKQHLVRHANSTLNFECETCGKKFRYRGELVRHEKTHEKAANNTNSISVGQDSEQSTVTVKQEVEELQDQ
ncbi:zinc finger protein 184 [Aedes albopictus]|uniref:C2h2-type zn-finger protein n=1 Tax=Aedes albopictus TaxID=7160 RepID=A0ABM1YHU8_AEDAL|nr:zinc finger protein 184 isoform X2 [Aedes albopictus]